MLTISLRAHNGQYFAAEKGTAGTIRANRDRIGAWEKFTLTNLTRSDNSLRNGDRINLKTAHGKYMVAEGGGGREVLAV